MFVASPSKWTFGIGSRAKDLVGMSLMSFGPYHYRKHQAFGGRDSMRRQFSFFPSLACFPTSITAFESISSDPRST